MKQKWGIRTFYLLLHTQAVSLLGSTMSGMAVGVWIFQETGLTTLLCDGLGNVPPRRALEFGQAGN